MMDRWFSSFTVHTQCYLYLSIIAEINYARAQKNVLSDEIRGCQRPSPQTFGSWAELALYFFLSWTVMSSCPKTKPFSDLGFSGLSSTGSKCKHVWSVYCLPRKNKNKMLPAYDMIRASPSGLRLHHSEFLSCLQFSWQPDIQICLWSLSYKQSVCD